MWHFFKLKLLAGLQYSLFLVFICCLFPLTLTIIWSDYNWSRATVWMLYSLVRNIIQLHGKKKRPQMQQVILNGVCVNCSFFFVMQMKLLITIQSHSSLIILVMMWINYQLNPWSHKSVADLLCIMGWYSRDGVGNTLCTCRHAYTRLFGILWCFSTDGVNTNLNADPHMHRYARKVT